MRKTILILIDSIIITFSFLFFLWLKPASLRIYLPQYLLSFVSFFCLWIVISFVLDKYNFKNKHTPKQYVSPLLKTSITALAVVLLLIILFNLLHYSRLIVLGTILLVTVLELFFTAIFYYHRKLRGELDLPSRFTKHATTIQNGEVDDQEIIQYPFPDLEDKKESIKEVLYSKYLSHSEELLQLIASKINLNGIHSNKSLVLYTHTPYNIENIDTESQQLFINLHKVNDIRRINQFFIQINSNIQFGGYFVGCVETINEKYRKFKQRYPIIVLHILYGINFFYTRVFPKMPILKEIYFALTKGNNRALSKAEVLGRLSYCGFNIISDKEINNLLYFIVQKVKKPSEDESPSYGHLIKLQRVGKEGKIIFIYKFRTMHPYSEYIQEYVCNSGGGTIDGDGFKNDFRITGWGKILRKFWIDELPMLIIFFRGEIKLVGVRPLSEHKYSLYDKEMQELRIKFKPGLVPPFYADLPKNFEELEESEYNYLMKYKKNPIKTDFNYFFKVWFNIIFRGARSK
ncbi:hypothetical protein D4R71_01370 [bacterium]|nr:MAG: hypothetical protein D4R71_01370 [bacterium]